MKVKKILKGACSVVDLDDISVALDGSEFSQSQQKIIDKLLKHFNAIQNEIATEFFLQKHTEEIDAEQRINFSDLSKDILKVLSLKDRFGENIPFKLFPDHIKFCGRASEITYAYIPEDNVLTDSANVNIPTRIYAFGIAREFYLNEGLVDKANLFEDKFKNALDSFFSSKRFLKIPERRWF